MTDLLPHQPYETMYHALLSNRYLTSRVIPLIAVGAVALCTALVIIVVSVMSGFVNMVRDAGKTLMGDVVIRRDVDGMPNYELLIDRLEADPAIRAATPVVDTFALIRMPYRETDYVQVWGIEPEGFARVTDYEASVYWRPLTPAEERTARADDPRRLLNQQVFEDGLKLQDSRTLQGGVVLGIHISKANERQRDGTYNVLGWYDGAPFEDSIWMPAHNVELTIGAISSSGARVMDARTLVVPVVNEYKSGVYQIDSRRVLMPLDMAQRAMGLDEARRVDESRLDPETGLPLDLGTAPARATMVLVRGNDRISSMQLKEIVERIYDELREELAQDESLSAMERLPRRGVGATILTWEEQNAAFIGPVEKERDLMRILFSIVYFVCAALVLVIFWAIVFEKTRDIGILRSIGTSRVGIVWIFVRYGFVVGVVGSIFGLGLGWLVVRNINTIHLTLAEPFPLWSWLTMLVIAMMSLAVTVIVALRGNLLPLVVGVLVTISLFGAGIGMVLHPGAMIWDPKIYYFEAIPNRIDWTSAVGTMIGAVVFSMIGSLIPAARAGDFDPVQALRFE